MWKYLNKGISTPIAIGIILVLAIIVGAVDYWQFSEIKDLKVAVTEFKIPEKEGMITDFEECANKGYPVSELFPRQCEMPDGKIFIERIEEVED